MAAERSADDVQSNLQDSLADNLALRVLGECRTSLMMAMRYLDVAFWKMPFTPKQFEGVIGTDGVCFYYNACNVIERFRLAPDEMVRDFLHLVLHCVFRQPFEMRIKHPMTWSYACDICVEAIALEMCGTRFPSEQDAVRSEVLKALSRKVEALTPAQIYRLLDSLRTAENAELAYDEQRLLRLLNESEALFIRDSHDFWNLSAPESSIDPDDTDESEEGDEPSQDSNDEGAGATSEQGEDENDEEGGQADASEGDEGVGSQGGQGDGSDSKDNSNSDNNPDDSDNNQGGSQDSERPEDTGAGDSDSTQDNGGAGNAEQNSSQHTPANSNYSKHPSQADQQLPQPQQPDQSAAQNNKNNAVQGSSAQSNSQPSQKPSGSSDQDQLQQPKQSELEQVQQDWEDISKQIEADLETFSQQHGSGAGNMMANLALANRSQVNYADFLRQFARMGEDMCLNDDEFDYIYYTYGLDHYGNMPLIEPLEYKESNRVREFVIALDTSGSCSGELVQRFVTRTYEILKSTQEFGTQVNLHIIQCDAAIQNDTMITSVDDFTRYLDSFEVHGYGGTDFRPVFNYIEELIVAGEFEDLRGLIYFTDGAGTYPDTPPAYDVAFVFVDDAGKAHRVPPWAMRVVIDETSISQL